MKQEDLKERVDHPKHYTNHPSGIECIEIIEHLPLNIGNAIKYIWRAGLKESEAPLREYMSARWYLQREIARIDAYEELPDRLSAKCVNQVWCTYAKIVCQRSPDGILPLALAALRSDRHDDIRTRCAIIISDLDRVIREIEEADALGTVRLAAECAHQSWETVDGIEACVFCGATADRGRR